MATTDAALTQEMKVKALKYAAEKGITLEQLIQEAVKKLLNDSGKMNTRDDPFFSDKSVFTGDAPSDLSENHDVYLYEESK